MSKEQNSLHLAGWIIDSKEETVARNGTTGYILSTVLRTDRPFFGGHHKVWFLNWIGLQTRTYLDIFAKHARVAGLEDGAEIESLSNEELSRRFLKVTISGWLCGNIPVVTEPTYLNVTECMRSEAKEWLAQMEARIDNGAWLESAKIASWVMAKN